MRKFYLYFPIFLDKMQELEWKVYVELMKINNKNICYFYYNLLMFSNCEYNDLKNLISSNIYYRI